MWSNQAGEKLIFRDEYDKMREEEPVLSFNDGKMLMQFKSSTIVFNRDEYPHDTAKQAARRVYEFLQRFQQPQISLGITSKDGVNWTIKPWKQFPERHIQMFVDDGIRHNYDEHDLDTWHWWFLNELTTLMKKGV
jgi:hypothetical protein